MEHWGRCQSPACTVLLMMAKPNRDYFPTGCILKMLVDLAVSLGPYGQILLTTGD